MSKVVFEPMPGKIAVKVEEYAEYRRAGLILLNNPNDAQMGEVVAIYEPFSLEIGSDELTEPYVKIGDMVVFGKFNGAKVTVAGQSCVILKESEILTKFRIEEEATKYQVEND